MSNYDDRLEHQRRCNCALLLGPLSGVATFSAVCNFNVPSWASLQVGVSALPLVMAASALVYWFTPCPQVRLGSQAHGATPRLLRPGNPILRQSNGAGGLLVALFLASFVGCAGLITTGGNEVEDFRGVSLAMMYLSLGLLFILCMATTHWIELDVDSLRILRHRMTFGLQRTSVEGAQAVRALGACRTASMTAYNVFAFTLDGQSLPISQERTDLREAQFEAERLSDQLMVPLLVGVEQQNHVNLARNIRGRGDEALPMRRDWVATQTPAELAIHRSAFPPID
ncbi:hypothetical protein IV102_23460 [bacterium]|nr:hypothetical protein [bacterium]